MMRMTVSGSDQPHQNRGRELLVEGAQYVSLFRVERGDCQQTPDHVFVELGFLQPLPDDPLKKGATAVERYRKKDE